MTLTIKAATASSLTATMTKSNYRSPSGTKISISMVTRATVRRILVARLPSSYSVVTLSKSTSNRKTCMSDSRRIAITPFRIALDFPHSSGDDLGGDAELDDDNELDDDMPPCKSNTILPGG
ncbi:hypothetical protein HYALB_00012942 [Hymenoscyphus albidus]|uniref:Uncharacterized protein n=1 Tax=Hymenoscyphus albidus TaxID=595503 RepID=A0A9N9LW17_9HELO|nr:hypothetical protein HYALB_00012942 [Hymenoscyphus albidus]